MLFMICIVMLAWIQVFYFKRFRQILVAPYSSVFSTRWHGTGTFSMNGSHLRWPLCISSAYPCSCISSTSTLSMTILWSPGNPSLFRHPFRDWSLTGSSRSGWSGSWEWSSGPRNRRMNTYWIHDHDHPVGIIPFPVPCPGCLSKILNLPLYLSDHLFLTSSSQDWKRFSDWNFTFKIFPIYYYLCIFAAWKYCLWLLWLKSFWSITNPQQLYLRTGIIKKNNRPLKVKNILVTQPKTGWIWKISLRWTLEEI